MKVLCPFCQNNTVIECPPESQSISCPVCSKRLRLRFLHAEEIASIKRGDGFLYTIQFRKKGRPRLERFLSQKSLALQKNHDMVIVRYGRDVLGIADQTRNYWFPVLPASKNRPLLRSLMLSLVWPISLLALLQIFRLSGEGINTLIDQPLGFLLALLLLFLLLSAPLLLWTMRTLFPLGPHRERIRGYDPRL